MGLFANVNDGWGDNASMLDEGQLKKLNGARPFGHIAIKSYDSKHGALG